MKTKMKKFPKTPFNLDCGDRPEVRQWLKDNGCAWDSGHDITSYMRYYNMLTIGKNLRVFYDNDASESHEYFNPFKKKSKLEERVEALEERMASIDTGIKECAAPIEEPKPVNVGRYKPGIGERYYYISNYVSNSSYIVNDVMNGHDGGLYRVSIGNCYRTKQEAEQALLRQQALVRVNDRIDELNDGCIADYNGYQYAISGIIEADVDITVLFKITPVSIFSTLCSDDKARTLISEMEEDIKLAAGWE